MPIENRPRNLKDFLVGAPVGCDRKGSKGKLRDLVLFESTLLTLAWGEVLGAERYPKPTVSGS